MMDITHSRVNKIKAEQFGLRVSADIALIESKQAREDYINGMREKRSDDELRSLHLTALEKAAIADKAYRALLGERKVQYYA